MTERKFYKTVVAVEILSEEPIEADGLTLDEIQHQITEGDWSGMVSVKSTKELNGKQAARALTNQASDPSFFRLKPDGTDGTY